MNAVQKLIAKLEATIIELDGMKETGSVITDIELAEFLQETQDLTPENEYGTSTVNKITRRLALSERTV